MLLRVVLCTFIVYQAVNAQSGLEAYENNPSVDYFWTTVRQTLLHFIDVWNLDNPANVVSRETLEEIWFPIERSFKDKIGSRSWMRISNHFKETMTHPQAAATLETLLNCIGRLLFHGATKEVKDLYKGLDKKKEAWENLYNLKVLFVDEFFKIQEDPDMKRSINAIKKFVLKKIRHRLGESTKESEHDDDSEEEKPSKHTKQDENSEGEKSSKHEKNGKRENREKKSHHKKSQS